MPKKSSKVRVHGRFSKGKLLHGFYGKGSTGPGYAHKSGFKKTKKR